MSVWGAGLDMQVGAISTRAQLVLFRQAQSLVCLQPVWCAYGNTGTLWGYTGMCVGMDHIAIPGVLATPM